MTRNPSPKVTRRRFLAGVAGATVGATAGCIDDVRNVVGRSRPGGVSLTIKTLPMDADPYAIRIARTLAQALETVGVETDLVPMGKEELYRQLLINHDFDLYVAGASARTDPDFLRPLFHSRYAGELGWQNPFGFSDLEVDDLLDQQHRSAGPDRISVVDELQTTLANRQPCTVVAFVDDIVAVRTDRFDGWDSRAPPDPFAYLMADAVGTAEDTETLTAFLRDPRPTKNLNPIAAEHRSPGTITDLLYDPLARVYGGTVEPWLAEDWSWRDSGDNLRVTVSLQDARWHDGERVTVDDVAFTYRFLADTTMGEGETPIPAERFRGRGSLVDHVDVDGDRVTFAFGDTAREVAERSLTLPILPEHVWREYTGPASVAGVAVREDITEALVWNNRDPVGSGPLRVESLAVEESLTLAATEDHFLSRVRGDLGAAVGDGPAFDRLEFRLAPSDAVVVELLNEGEGDVAGGSLGADVVPSVGRSSVLDLVVHPSRTFYHVGYNTRRQPLSNPQFRRAVARLVDKGDVVSSVFDGYATPATSPLAMTDWVAPDLVWTGEDPILPYAGEGGELDEERARDLFVEAGFRYHDGSLQEA